MKIEVFGTGCPKCNALEEAARNAPDSLEIMGKLAEAYIQAGSCSEDRSSYKRSRDLHYSPWNNVCRGFRSG